MSRAALFKKMRALGKAEFTYKGKRYNTMEKGETKKTWRAALKNIRKYVRDTKGDSTSGINSKDTKDRKDIKGFVTNFNQKHNTNFQLSGVSGDEHRHAGENNRTSVNHVSHGGSDFSMYGGTDKQQKKLIGELSGAGYRSIDERDVRGIIHFDNNTEGQGKFRPRQKMEEVGSSYPSRGIAKEVYQNEMLPEQKKSQQILHNEQTKEYKERANKIDNFMSPLVEHSSKQIMSSDVTVEKEPLKKQEPIKMDFMEKMKLFASMRPEKGGMDEQLKDVFKRIRKTEKGN